MKKWYENGAKKELDMSKPILAQRASGTYLLIPEINKGDYEVIGYNWINIETGARNSCCTYITAKEAVEAYSGYHPFNATISYLPDKP